MHAPKLFNLLMKNVTSEKKLKCFKSYLFNTDIEEFTRHWVQNFVDICYGLQISALVFHHCLTFFCLHSQWKFTVSDIYDLLMVRGSK